MINRHCVKKYIESKIEKWSVIIYEENEKNERKDI